MKYGGPYSTRGWGSWEDPLKERPKVVSREDAIARLRNDAIIIPFDEIIPLFVTAVTDPGSILTHALDRPAFSFFRTYREALVEPSLEALEAIKAEERDRRRGLGQLFIVSGFRLLREGKYTEKYVFPDAILLRLLPLLVSCTIPTFKEIQSLFVAHLASSHNLAQEARDFLEAADTKINQVYRRQMLAIL